MIIKIKKAEMITKQNTLLKELNIIIKYNARCCRCKNNINTVTRTKEQQQFDGALKKLYKAMQRGLNELQGGPYMLSSRRWKVRKDFSISMYEYIYIYRDLILDLYTKKQNR